MLSCIVVGVLLKTHAEKQPLPPRPVPRNWSIGIYTGSEPFKIGPPIVDRNPVLMASDVTDVKANYVADPFMVKEGSTWYLFCEVLNRTSKRGEIGYAESKDGLNWKYRQIVLREPFHLSYPYVFKWNNTYYMIPESRQSKSVRLYRAVQFPQKWVLEKKLLNGDYVDNSVVHYNGKWWMFCGARPHWNDTLELFFSNNLTGPWIKHPKSPIVNKDPKMARPAGRIEEINGKLVRFAQNNKPVYGSQVRAFEITNLTMKDYNERELPCSPLLKGTGTGWNANRMHTVDLHHLPNGHWIASVDGYR